MRAFDIGDVAIDAIDYDQFDLPNGMGFGPFANGKVMIVDTDVNGFDYAASYADGEIGYFNEGDLKPAVLH